VSVTAIVPRVVAPPEILDADGPTSYAHPSLIAWPEEDNTAQEAFAMAGRRSTTPTGARPTRGTRHLHLATVASSTSLNRRDAGFWTLHTADQTTLMMPTHTGHLGAWSFESIESDNLIIIDHGTLLLFSGDTDKNKFHYSGAACGCTSCWTCVNRIGSTCQHSATDP
jgi:hypothetical protein